MGRLNHNNNLISRARTRKRASKTYTQQSHDVVSSGFSLYSFSSITKLSLHCSIFLILSFVLQGTHFAYADEVTESLPLPEVSLVATGVSDDFEQSNNEYDLPLVMPDPEPVIEDSESIVDSGGDTSLVSDSGYDDVNDVRVATSSTVSIDDAAVSEKAESDEVGYGVLLSEDTIETPADREEVDTSSAPDSPPESFLPYEDDSGGPPGDPDIFEDDSGGVSVESLLDTNNQTSSTSSQVDLDVSASAEGFTAYVESDSAFSFDRDACTKLASGSYYCQETPETLLSDALYAAPDTDGDLEIFFIKDGIETQITSNVIDDAAPYFDPNSNTIVWHRLINDRYQIVSFDVETGIENILTQTKENNMEPTRQGKYTVWQRWVNGGWNIILHNGKTEVQITKTSSHNIAPYIHGSLVVWNRHNISGDKSIEMYDIANETYVTIQDSEGLSVSNPRMVFVYDSLNASGDLITRGYDILAKEFIDLDTLPRNIPDEIPPTDSTGETRALIQIKGSQKNEIEESLGEDDGIGLGTSTPPTPETETVATSTSSQQVYVPNETLDLRNEQVVPVEPVEVLTEYDLIIPSYGTSSEPVND